ncbi:hypothetical protein PISMIDRAFT_16312 [Pisolithus microcarpus 441]|uniref:Unplaced genomic scaffold scaffold_195, whole genome shotgun sequence n=1 Tax=Pisolithus microcarpus 441 TaxID=765257 RepID=A0A0C9YGF0_9AGAM|nr:hypothetical protein BKA83DRAFT_16312 [Pisolithus microcarpus]KIK15736.1 hypothetical protein PISMIDRAFT_16312 [Pisolithus microcarpus 441]
MGMRWPGVNTVGYIATPTSTPFIRGPSTFILEYFPSELDPSLVSVLRAVLRRLGEAGATLTRLFLQPSTRLVCTMSLQVWKSLATSPALTPFAMVFAPRHRWELKSRNPATYLLTRVPPVLGRKFRNAFCSEHTHLPDHTLRCVDKLLFASSAFDNYFLQAQRIRLHLEETLIKCFAIPVSCWQSRIPPGMVSTSYSTPPPSAQRLYLRGASMEAMVVIKLFPG